MNDPCIYKGRTIFDALSQINSISLGQGTKILFVVDEENRVVGALSDGDCRRCLIAHSDLSLPVESAMRKDFIRIDASGVTVELLRIIKRAGVRSVPELDAKGHLVRIVDFSEGRSCLPIDAVLMAGGKGERLRPLTLDTPKPLLKVDGKSIIDYNVENLLRYGIKRINITVNYLANQIEKHFADMKGADFVCIREETFLGTMGAVQCVKEWHNDIILLMNSDLFTNIDIEAFYINFVESGADMCAAAVPYNVDLPYGVFVFNEDKDIVGLKEKPSYYYYANAGVYLLKRDVIDIIPRDVMFHSTDMMRLLIQKGKKVTHFPIAGYWIDIGKPEDFKKAQEFARYTNMRGK